VERCLPILAALKMAYPTMIFNGASFVMLLNVVEIFLNVVEVFVERC